MPIGNRVLALGFSSFTGAQMAGRRYFVTLVAAVIAASVLLISGPAGAAVSDACTETNNPGIEGNPAGLNVECTFTNAGLGTAITIKDYDSAVWHAGAVRNVSITESRGQTGQTSGSTAGKTYIKDTTTTATSLAIGTADINHSIEGPGIAPGSFIKSVSSGVVTLNLKTVAGGPVCSGSPPATNCATTLPTTVKVANSTARSVADGHTTAGSSTVTSATMNFNSTDVGMGFGGGDLPDGATIATVNSSTSVTLACNGCVGTAFSNVSTCPTSGTCGTVGLSIEPTSAQTSARFVTDGTFSNSHTISSTSAEFAKSDIGLVVTGTGISVGSRITAVATNGASATLGGSALTSGTNKRFTIGLPTKTAPSNTDIVGQFSPMLLVNPALNSSSPACSANKLTAAQIPIQWRNPGSYDLVSNGSTKFSGTVVSPTSTAQLEVPTSSASFAGYLKQNVTVTNGVPTTSGWTVKFEFLPIGIGVCPGSTAAESWNFDAISLAEVMAPGGTGPGSFSNVRSFSSIPQGTSQLYTGTSGAVVTTSAASQPTNSNDCTLVSPPNVQIGC